MSILIDSLKHLYENEQIKIEKINNLLENGKINQEEYDYIVNK